MCDPVANLPFEIIANVLSFLTPKELGECALLSSSWNESANSNYVWEILCDALWRDKAYVPEEFRTAKQIGFPKRAYMHSLQDAHRVYIKPEELSEFVWNFRFKESAGEHWLSNDPWWKEQKPARVRFLADGRMSSLDGWPASIDESSGRPLERRWRFISSAAGRQGPKGSFVQINNFPPLVVSRYKNWGFLLESCWVFYTSFPLPPRGACLDLEDTALDITTETMKQEAMRYNIGVEFNLHDHAQILDLLQLLAHIHQPHGFDIDLPNIGGDDDDDDEIANDDANNDPDNGADVDVDDGDIGDIGSNSGGDYGDDDEENDDMNDEDINGAHTLD